MKVISCREAVSRMFEFLGGAISSQQKNGLDVHLKKCRHCCDRFEFEKLFKEKLAKVALEEKTPKDLVKRVRELF